MSNINDIVTYVTDTPNNTNRRVLKTMLNSISGSSNKGEEAGIEIVEELPIIADEGSIYYINTRVKPEAFTLEEAITKRLEAEREAYNKGFANQYGSASNLEEFTYKKYALRKGLDTFSELDENQKEEARQEILNYYDFNNEDKTLIVKLKGNEPAELDMNIEEFSSGSPYTTYIDGERFEYYNINDSESMLLYNSSIVEDDYEAVYIEAMPIVSGEVKYYNNDYYFHVNDKFYKSSKFLISTNGENKMVPIIYMARHKDYETREKVLFKYFFESDKRDSFRVYENAFYIKEPGEYHFYTTYTDFLENFSSVVEDKTYHFDTEFFAKTAGWYGTYVEIGKEAFEALKANNFKAPEGWNDLIETATGGIDKIDITKFPNQKVVPNNYPGSAWLTTEGVITIENSNVNNSIVEYHDIQEVGFYIFQDNGWGRISNFDSDLFGSLINKNEMLTLYGHHTRIGGFTPYLENNILNYSRIDISRDGADPSSGQIDLSPIITKTYYSTYSREEILAETGSSLSDQLEADGIRIKKFKSNEAIYLIIENKNSSYEEGTYGSFEWIKINYSNELSGLETRIAALEQAAQA